MKHLHIYFYILEFYIKYQSTTMYHLSTLNCLFRSYKQFKIDILASLTAICDKTVKDTAKWISHFYLRASEGINDWVSLFALITTSRLRRCTRFGRWRPISLKWRDLWKSFQFVCFGQWSIIRKNRGLKMVQKYEQ